MSAASHLPRLTSHRPATRRPLAVLAIALVVIGLAVALGLRTLQGSSSSSAGATGSSGAAFSGPEAGPGARADTASKAPSAAPGTPSGTAGAAASQDVLLGTKIARLAWVGIKVTDLSGAAARARVVATGVGGQVTSENVVTSIDPTGGLSRGSTGRSTGGSTGGSTGSSSVGPRVESDPSLGTVGVNEARMVLTVPAKALDDVLTELSKIGTVSYRSSQSQDVTDAYVDTRARIEPMRAGIDRIRALLAKTTDLQQVITLETELSSRQADLDSLTQRLAQLDAMTTMSDVTVSMWTDATEPAQSDTSVPDGLRGAWDGLLASVTVIVTGLAVLLPWLVVLVPVTLLGLRLWRRRGVAGADLPSPAAAKPAAAAPGPPTSTSGTSPSGD